jgi:DNA-binding transcriptional regulator YiaG
MKSMAKKRSTSPTPAQIRALRLRLGLTLEEIADKVGVSARTWMSWELPSQKRKPGRLALRLLKVVFPDEF